MNINKKVKFKEEIDIIDKLPSKFKEDMRDLLGSEYDDFIDSYNDEKTSSIRLNTLKMNQDDFEKLNLFEINLAEDKIKWANEGYYISLDKRPSMNPLFDAGLYYIQEPSAMSVVGQSEIDMGDYILDMCASPGGKSTYILSKLDNSGFLVSNEFNKSRLKALGENLEKFGAINSLITNMSSKELLKFFKGYFDKIFIDAPCSGQGMFRKDEYAIEDWSEDKVDQCCSIQEELMTDAYYMLKDQGTIIYSTCTFTKSENEEIVNNFLCKFKNTELIYMDRIWPHKEKGEGHFCAKIKKLNTNDNMDEEFMNKNNKKSKKKNKPCDYKCKEFEEFSSKFLKDDYSKFIKKKYKFIDRSGLLYIFPKEIEVEDMPKTLRKGLLLGKILKNRFEPAHSFAMILNKNKVKNYIDFKYDNENISRYLSGQSIATNASRSWTLVCVNGIGLGWAKESNGQLKNKYPKGLRKNI